MVLTRRQAVGSVEGGDVAAETTEDPGAAARAFDSHARTNPLS